MGVRGSNVGFCTWQVCENSLVGDEVFASIYGFTPERVAAGVQIEDIIERIAPGDRERIAKEVHDAILDGRPYTTTFAVISPKGFRNVTFVGRCLRDSQGLPNFFSGTLTDHGTGDDPSDIESAESHCRTALGLARAQKNEDAIRHLAKALTALGAVGLH